MASTTSAPIPPKYQDVPPTTADLDYADLITLDLSLFDAPDGKQKLADQLKTAISTTGFFYVTNFGIAPEKVDEQFNIAQELFSMQHEEKMQFRVGEGGRGFFGYKPKGARKAQFGLSDNLELYDDQKYNGASADLPRPSALEKNKDACKEFGRHMHFFVLYRVMYICGLVMELPDPEALWKLHRYEEPSQCHLRYMLYHPRTSAELAIMKENKLEENVYGHTDFGSLTLLMRQPVAGLQARIEDGSGEKKWKWVRPVENSLTVNVADTLSFLTGGYLKSTIHRVVLPPEDQRHVPRYGVIYFSGPDDSTLLRPIESPVLKRVMGEKAREGEDVGLQGRELPPDTMTAGEWVRVRFGSIDKNYQTNRDNAVEVGSRKVAAYANDAFRKFSFTSIIIFITSATVVETGQGLSTQILCYSAAIICLVFYTGNKLAIYVFLLERARVLRAPFTSRLKDWIWVAGIIVIVGDFGTIAIIGYISPVVDLSTIDGRCRIGLPPQVSFPLMSFDVGVNFALTGVFIYLLKPVLASSQKWSFAGIRSARVAYTSSGRGSLRRMPDAPVTQQ
ncbi:hypothetical protein BDV96DRAFT_644350 [Lophiotrema nucula]|uniref:Fe2OG dioxygenase domain-containing protein n=1 Tax=Lophiotrema nucula TaxID=690887 RepID=A0A6A5ZEU4_9PLEO|nr:hypothetical protein BDV96DRAFT_644350 [Lophiotrema nucula]